MGFVRSYCKHDGAVMKRLDLLLAALHPSLLMELEDIYELWSWHPGMG